MKNKKAKENIIGKIIYGFILFMPLMVVLFTSLYATFNDNAYESYYGQTINQRIQNNLNTNSPRLDTTYFLDIDSTIPTTDTYLYIENFKLTENGNLTQTFITRFTDETVEIGRIRFYEVNNGRRAEYSTYNGTSYSYYTFTLVTDYTYQISFNLVQTTKTNVTEKLFYYTYNKYSYLDNSFEYGLYKAEQNPLFNWSKNTGLYTVLNTTCTTLGINTTFIPFIFAYWLLVSLIYILYDIALVGIHIIHNKIHELEGTF